VRDDEGRHPRAAEEPRKGAVAREHHLHLDAVRPQPGGGLGQNPLGPLGVAWLGLLLVGLARIARRAAALRDELACAAVPVPADVRELVAACARQVGLARVPRLRLSSATRVPFVAGVLRPRVVLPARLGGDALRFALLHELAHLRHRDHVLVLPELVLRTVYWFHPLVRWALSRLREEREHRCDRLVARLTGARASYARFLLEEVRAVRLRPREVPILALREGRSAVGRRVRRILNEGELEMNRLQKLAGHLATGVVAAALFGLLALGPAPAARGQEETAGPDLSKLDHINATKTKEAGVYHVMPVFRDLAQVRVILRGGPYGKEHTRVLTPGADYVFDAAKGNLRLTVPVDDEKEMVLVYGTRTMPWAWRAGEPLASVRVLLGEREGVRGTDFDFDAATGVIRFLRAELCDGKQQYFITYDFPPDPAHPEIGRAGSIGNHGDRAAVRRFLGLPGQESAGATGGVNDSIGTNASPTADPRVWTLVQPMDPDSVRVAISKRGEPGHLAWFERGKEFLYDPSASKLVFLRDVTVDPEDGMLFVQGVPKPRNVFHRHKALTPGTVTVVLDGRTLPEGTGFTVDYATGTITVLDDAIRSPGCRYRISAESWTYGNG